MDIGKKSRIAAGDQRFVFAREATNLSLVIAGLALTRVLARPAMT
jgi:hypothetical protein